MPGSSNLARYPRSYLDLANEFEGTKAKRRKVVKCGSEREARRMRFDLYAFQGALRKSGMAEDYGNFLHTRMFVVGATLRIVHADDTAPALK